MKLGITFAKAESLLELENRKTLATAPSSQKLNSYKSCRMLSPSPQKQLSVEMRRILSNLIFLRSNITNGSKSI